MSFKEQILNVQGQISVSILHQIEAIVLIILQIFFSTCAGLKIEEYSGEYQIFPS